MTRAPQHYSVGTGEIKDVARLLWCVDVAVGEDGNANHGFYFPNRLVFGLACIKVRTCASVHSERLHAACLRNSRDAHAVTIVTIPSRADLQRDRHAHRSDDGF